MIKSNCRSKKAKVGGVSESKMTNMHGFGTAIGYYLALRGVDHSRKGLLELLFLFVQQALTNHW